MNLLTENYLTQNNRWPQQGRHILAQFDDDSVVVYQAYRPEIGLFAAQHGYFGGAFLLTRMSWIKPNFLWMMYRSGWGNKTGQAVVLAVRLKRFAFDKILSLAVHSSFKDTIYKDEQQWREQLKSSSVRLQWDPDHDPLGKKEQRKAIQLGLRGEILANYSKEWIISIEDISDFAREQGEIARRQDYHKLILPQENVYPVQDDQVARHLQLSVVR